MAGAGFGHFRPVAVGVVMAVVATFCGLFAIAVFSVLGLGLATGVLALAAQFEILVLRSRARNSAVLRVFPEVIEAVHSAVVSGLDLNLAFLDLARVGPKSVRSSFAQVSHLVDSGVALESTMRWLKNEFGSPQVDQFCEYLVLSQHSGGVALAENLKALSTRIREDATLRQEISAKQGWVIGTAKLALATPWLIVALLAQRPENAAAYNSPSGLLVLGGALCLCLLAYLSVNLMSGLPVIRRVHTA